MPSTRALLIALVTISLIVVACGTEPVAQVATAVADDPPTGTTETETAPTPATPTPKPTAVPAVFPAPTSPTPAATKPPEPTDELEVNFLDAALMAPSTPSVFEELLARIPDTELTRKDIMLSDIAAMRDVAGMAQPAPGVGTDALDSYFDEIADAYDEGLPIAFPIWPAGLRDYVRSFDTLPYLGFGLGGINQTASAGVPPDMFDVALGRYDPEVTADALAICDCDQPEIREHNGVSYYAWGEGLRGDLNDRLKPPFYDHIGRGPRLLIEDGVASYSIRDGNIPALIDASLGVIPSLADNEDYTLAIRWLAFLGTNVDALIKNSGFSVDEAIAASGGGRGLTPDRSGGTIVTERTAESATTAVNKGPLLLPFTLIASGASFDGDRGFTGLVLVHEDSASAEENVQRLIGRIREGATDGRIQDSEYTDTPWTDLIRRIDVQACGRFLVARLYPVDPLRLLTQGTFSNPILIVHE